MDNVFIEALHLQINTGNSWFEVTRDCLQYALLPDASEARDVGEPGNEHTSWQLSNSGSIQTQGWLNAGFNFEELVSQTLQLKKPITKFHGAQIQTLFGRRQELWDAMESNGGFAALRRSDVPQFRELPDKLIALWDGLAAVHKAVDSWNPDLAALEATVTALQATQQWFYDRKQLRPFRALEKWYDHAVAVHVIDQMKRLSKRGFSLVSVSSRFLEHLNKTMKAVAQRLPGGGKAREGEAHLPTVQAFKKVFAVLAAGRAAVYEAYAKEQGPAGSKKQRASAASDRVPALNLLDMLEQDADAGESDSGDSVDGSEMGDGSSIDDSAGHGSFDDDMNDEL